LIDVLPDGSRRLIVAGIRVIDHPDGSIERAREILPSGTPKVVQLPNRVGGGLLFYIVNGGSTQLWRAKEWLDKLTPVAEVWGAVADIVPGFDRVYARLLSGEIRALDLDSGRQLSLGNLPAATRIGFMAFADAWRGVAVVDFRGALATFDAGNSWRPIPLETQNVSQVSVRDGSFVLETSRGRVLLSANGEVARDESHDAGPPRGLLVVTENPLKSPSVSDRSTGGISFVDKRGLGRRPLRAVVEDGWPVGGASENAAVFAQRGTLFRVGLRTGAILESRAGAFREQDDSCHPLPLGDGFGFVCGASDEGTALYAFERPFGMRELVRFAHPRVVLSSGNGGFVVRGSCARDAEVSSATNAAFCFFPRAGAEREIRPTGAIARETAPLHPVMLRDGRPIFLVPPRESASGQLLVPRGGDFAAVSLDFEQRDAWLKRGQVLEGVEEREPGVLSAWVLTGPELRGIRIGLDGKIEVARTGANVEQTIVTGRFALEWGKTGRGAETIDGGLTWTPVELPTVDLPRPFRNVAACGPVGCAQSGWLRVGWGSVREFPDLAKAPAPAHSRVTLAPARGISLQCEPTGEFAGPSPKPVAKPPGRPDKSARSSAERAAAPTVDPRARALPPVFVLTPPPKPAHPADLRLQPGASPVSKWSPFRGQAPPALGPADVGLEAGTDPPLVMQARIYTWGARGAEWLRTGHVQARFDDRFDLAGIHTTATTLPSWSDEERAADALGLTAGQTLNWTSLLDVSGQAALLIGQRGSGRADLYAAAQGEPLLAFRDSENAPLPVPSSVVRLGPTWFFLASSMTPPAWSSTVYRVDGGVVRRLARLPRIPVPPGEFTPRLVRRSQSQGLGILVQGSPGFDQVIRDWYVLPLDPDSGELDDPVRLFGSDLEGEVPPRCPADRDGWVVNTEVIPAPAVRVVSPSPANISSIELRLRLDPGHACIDAIAARAEGLPAPPHAGANHHAPPNVARMSDSELPLAATDPSSGRRWLLRCR